MLNYVNGNNLVVFQKSGATFKTLGLAQDCTVAVEMETTTIKTKDDVGNFPKLIPGDYTWSVSANHLFSQDAGGSSGYTYDDYMDLMLLGQEITISIAQISNPGAGWPQTIGSKKNLTGNALITKIDISSKAGDPVTYSIEMKGSGPITHV